VTATAHRIALQHPKLKFKKSINIYTSTNAPPSTTESGEKIEKAVKDKIPEEMRFTIENVRLLSPLDCNNNSENLLFHV